MGHVVDLFAHVSEVKRASSQMSVAAMLALDQTTRAVRDSDRYRRAVERQKRRRRVRAPDGRGVQAPPW